MSSFTLPSTANPFILRGATPVFVDIRPDTMNIDEKLIEAAINEKTKAIAAGHYAGGICEMDEILRIAQGKGLYVNEDADPGVLAAYQGRALDSLGHLGSLSFHETKNYTCGEGGALPINAEDSHIHTGIKARILDDLILFGWNHYRLREKYN